MDAHRVVAAQFEQSVQRRRLGHVILGMHLEETQAGPCGRDLRRMRQAQADPRIAVGLRWRLRHDHGSGTVSSDDEYAQWYHALPPRNRPTVPL